MVTNPVRQSVLVRVAATNVVAATLLMRPAYAQPGPPVAPVRNVVDTYFGTTVTDPYRWMEDSHNPELLGWMRAQAAYTRAQLDPIPGRQRLLDRLTELTNAVPARISHVGRLPGEVYVYLKTAAHEGVASLCIRRGLTGPETRLVDPNRVKRPDGQPTSISYYVPSWNGRWVAVGLAAGGSENTVIHVYDVATGRQLTETIDRARYGGIAWLPDNRSFFYVRLPNLPPNAPPAQRQQQARVYRHVVGTPAEADRVLFGHGVHAGLTISPALIPRLRTFAGSPYVVGTVETGVGGGKALYVTTLSALDSAGAGAPWRQLCEPADDVTDVAVHGNDLYLVTHKNTPRYRVLRTSLSHPDLARADVVVPPGEAVISGSYIAGEGALHVAQDALYVQQLDGGLGRIRRIPFRRNEPESDVPLPFSGTLTEVAADARVPGLTFALTSWTRADRFYGWNPATRQTTDLGLQPSGPFDALRDVVTEEVKVRAADGTLIPLSIVYRKNPGPAGGAPPQPRPTWLNGYGAYGIPQVPGNSPMLTAWLEQGGIYAVAHVRGGGEYGEEWHRAGQKATKPNTWQDFIACAEYLIREQYTTPGQLGGLGISAGGILMGRAMTERPDLFRAVGIAVGLTDMLRYETTANGVPNISEFGSVKTEEGFRNLYQMSAYHHVQNGTHYPAVLLATGLNDPRVDPWLMAKMTARLQAASVSGRPVLLRVDEQAGHGPGVTKQQRIALFADGMAFLLWQLGHPDFQPPWVGVSD